LLELIKFSHTLFALPFAMLATLLAVWSPAGVRVRASEIAGILLCMVFARTAAMAFNRLVDRRIDAANPRTAMRHLPAGTLSVRSVVALVAFAATAFVASTALFLPNIWPLALSVPVLCWLLAYSYTKRFTQLAHFWLGLSLALAPICAWIALRGSVDRPPIALGVGVFFWVAGFDIIYACQDADFDRRSGLRSIPARWGVANALRVAAACHAVTVLALAALAAIANPPLGPLFAAAVAAVAALLVYEHSLVRENDLTRVNRAFFNVNLAISCGLLLVGALDIFF
jgi:4-hydroxybenzoate polyprenyltransferase